MKYIVDKELKYNEEILNHLTAYNDSHTGSRPSEKTYIYILDNKELVGALHAQLAWDCVNLNESFYTDFKVLKLMVAKISKLYKNKASGIRVHTDDLQRINDFKKLGFEIEGILQGSPNSKDDYSFAYYYFDIISDSDLEVIVKKEAIISYEDILRKQDPVFNVKHQSREKKDEISFVALEKDTFVGGVKAIIYEKSMYIDLFVVTAENRGKKIGSKLLELAEKEAKKRKLDRIELVTVLASEFYEKRGYEIVITKKEQPKGFDCYTLLKNIKY